VLEEPTAPVALEVELVAERDLGEPRGGDEQRHAAVVADDDPRRLGRRRP